MRVSSAPYAQRLLHDDNAGEVRDGRLLFVLCP